MANLIREHIAPLIPVMHVVISDIVKKMTHEHYGLDCAPLTFEDIKDHPSILFNGLSPRDAYIDYSENVIKPEHGDDYFGVRTAKALHAIKDQPGLILMPGAGYAEEVAPIVKEIGPENIMLVRLAAGEWDVRAQLDLPGVETVDFIKFSQPEIEELIRTLIVPKIVRILPEPLNEGDHFRTMSENPESANQNHAGEEQPIALFS